MLKRSQSIVLIGFKHVGKSTLACALSRRCGFPVIDVDFEMERVFGQSCRELMRERGEDAFRALETQVLVQSLARTPAIIALGGGGVLLKENHALIQNQCIIHVTAQRDVVFSRIQQSGVPAFWGDEESMPAVFNRLWDNREPLYQQLAHRTVDNSASIDASVEQVLHYLSGHYELHAS